MRRGPRALVLLLPLASAWVGACSLFTDLGGLDDPRAPASEVGIGGSKALRFDGSSTRGVLAQPSLAFGGMVPFSVELWVRAEVVDDTSRR